MVCPTSLCLCVISSTRPFVSAARQPGGAFVYCEFYKQLHSTTTGWLVSCFGLEGKGGQADAAMVQGVSNWSPWSPTPSSFFFLVDTLPS